MINPDICNCCGEIWNRQNLKKIPLGKHEMHLCPDCYAEYIKLFDKIRAEITSIADSDGCGDYLLGFNFGLMRAAQIIDKYRLESEKR